MCLYHLLQMTPLRVVQALISFRRAYGCKQDTEVWLAQGEKITMGITQLQLAQARTKESDTAMAITTVVRVTGIRLAAGCRQSTGPTRTVTGASSCGQGWRWAAAFGVEWTRGWVPQTTANPLENILRIPA